MIQVACLILLGIWIYIWIEDNWRGAKTMVKVKIFFPTPRFGELEATINEWIANHSEAIVQDVKYTMSDGMHGAMILYKVLM